MYEDSAVLRAGVTHHEATVSAVMSALGDVEGFCAAHAHGRGGVGDPGGSERLCHGRQTQLLEPLRSAALDVLHPRPLLLLRRCRDVEGLAWGPEQPLVVHSHSVLQVVLLEFLQTKDLLVAVPAAWDHNAAVHQDVVEQEEGFGLRFASAQLQQTSFSDQDATRSQERLPARHEGILHGQDALTVFHRELRIVHHHLSLQENNTKSDYRLTRVCAHRRHVTCRVICLAGFLSLQLRICKSKKKKNRRNSDHRT